MRGVSAPAAHAVETARGSGAMNRVALVTGGARGIGRAIAEELAPDHAIAITYRSGAAEAKLFSESHPDALCIQADFRDVKAEALIEQVIAHFGRLDLLVNNAGVIGASPIESFDEDAALDMLRMNLVSPLALIAAAQKRMKPGGAIVNITSVNAKFPPAKAPVYAASKAGLDIATVALAKRLGRKGIRVNAVAPGAIERVHAPRPPAIVSQIAEDSALGRLPSGIEVARAVRYLGTPASEGVTGEVITVSAGYKL